MKLEEIFEEIKNDSEIDMHRIDHESVKLPSMHSKYLTLRAKEKILLKSLNIQYASAYKDRWLFYAGKATPQQYKDENFDLKVMRGDVDIFIAADKTLKELKDKISVQETKVETIEDFLKAIMQRHWQLSNAIKWQQMMQGGLA